MPEQPYEYPSKSLNYFNLRSHLCLDRLRNDLIQIRRELEEQHGLLGKQQQEEGQEVPLSIPKTLACLQPGSIYVGTQSSQRCEYQVTVMLKEVDIPASRISGYLQIEHLTSEFPQLTTFFEGEIIGREHRFITGKWDSTVDNDGRHWSRFAHFIRRHEQHWRDPNYHFDHTGEEMLYMRWKEEFLVPDHRVKEISGASYEGFYYMAFDVHKRSWEGFYFHRNSEEFQSITLRQRAANGPSPSYQYR